MTPEAFDYLAITPDRLAPLYLIDFDKQGRSEGPLTRAHLLDTLSSDRFTDVYLFSHGWNNLFREALGLYQSFFNGYLDIRRALGLNDTSYRPLFIGIIWPSTALVLPWERGPDFAGAPLSGTAPQSELQEQKRREVRLVADTLREADIEEFYTLSEKPLLTPAEALRLATLLTPLYASADHDIGPSGLGSAPTAEEIVAAWQRIARAAGDTFPQEHGFADEDVEETAPGVAGITDFLDPRRPIQLATVLLMKDRAATVGAHGVGSLLQELLARSGLARLHLLGHSYGARVILSALCFPQHTRKVHSVLLLQPATSYLCFAANVDGQQYPGGYRLAFDRSETPLFVTYSPHDMPLTTFFHLAVRRATDLGDVQIAGAPPSKFAALGGFGPGGLLTGEGVDFAIPQRPARYPVHPGAQVYALNGRQGISGHGDVSNPVTWWALVNQSAGDRLP